MKTKRRGGLPKVVYNEIYASENFRVVEILDAKNQHPYGVEIHQRTKSGHGVIAYLTDEAYEIVARQTHEWSQHMPAQSECEDFFERAMFSAPQYPLDLH